MAIFLIHALSACAPEGGSGESLDFEALSATPPRADGPAAR